MIDTKTLLASASIDPASLLADQRRRAYFRSLSAESKSRMLPEMERGEHADIVAAILRPPISNGKEQHVVNKKPKCNQEDSRRAERMEGWGRMHAILGALVP